MPFVNIGERKIYYSARGESGTPILFIHGAAGNHLVWGLQVRALGDFGRAVAIDLPGHGRSDPPGCDTIDAYRESILGVMNALQFERAVLVGHSMGGAIAQAFALAAPKRVTGLVLVGTGTRLRVLPAILNGVLTDPDRTAALVIENSYAAGLDPDFRKRAEDEFRACPPAVAYGDFRACNQFDLTSHIAEIGAPTLVLCGKQDRMTPLKFSLFLASHIPNASLVLLDDAGHSAMIEQPDSVSNTLIEFIKRL